MRSNKTFVPIQINELELKSIKLPYDEGKSEEFRVPKFLIEAFDYIKRHEGFKCEGIFRRQGNNQRIESAEAAFYGRVKIPEDCTPVDVAVLIKRFFHRIDGGIFQDKETRIIDFAMDGSGKTMKKPFGMFTIVKALPRLNLATLAFLMHRLHRISEFSQYNKMDAHNLGTCIAPSLFINTDLQGKPGQNKDDIKSGIDAITNVLATLITRHTELAKPPIMLRETVGQHVPTHHASMNRVGSSYSVRSASCNLNSGASATFETPQASHVLPPTGSITSTTSERVGERDKKKQSAKRRGSSVVRSLKNLSKLFPGRRTSGICDDPPQTTSSIKPIIPRKNTSSSELGQPQAKSPIHRSCSFRGPFKPVSAPILYSDRKRQDLQRQNSMFCIKTPEDRFDGGQEESANKVEAGDSNVIDLRSSLKEESRAVEQNVRDTPTEQIYSTEYTDIPPTPMKEREIPLNKKRRNTAPVRISLKRNQPNTMTAGLKDGRKAVRRNTLNYKRPNNENIESGIFIGKSSFKRFTKQKSQVAPEGSLHDSPNDAFMKNGLEPTRAFAIPAVLRERTPSTVNSQENGFTKDLRLQNNSNNVASLIKKFDANVGVRPS